MSVSRGVARHGYMLLEALVAGSVVAVSVATLLHHFGLADGSMSATTRMSQCMHAFRDGIAQAHAVRFSALSVGTTTDHPAGCLERVVTISTPINTSSVTHCAGCREVLVAVRWKAVRGRTRTLAGSVFRSP